MEDRELVHRNCEATPIISDLGLKRGFGSCVQVNKYTAVRVGILVEAYCNQDIRYPRECLYKKLCF